MDYHKALREGTQELFQTMVFMDIEPLADPEIAGQSNDELLISGMIGLGGEIKGMLAVAATESMAKAVTGSLLGAEVAELNDDVRDAFGEIANMVAGTLKTSCAEHLDIQLAIPTTIIGESLHFSGMKGAQHVQVSFSSEYGVLHVFFRFREV